MPEGYKSGNSSQPSEKTTRCHYLRGSSNSSHSHVPPSFLPLGASCQRGAPFPPLSALQVSPSAVASFFQRNMRRHVASKTPVVCSEGGRPSDRFVRVAVTVFVDSVAWFVCYNDRIWETRCTKIARNRVQVPTCECEGTPDN